MKKFIHVTMILLFAVSANSQTWQWSVKAGGTSNDNATSIDVDDFGNSYITGKFYDSISFGSTTLINPGTWSLYIAKYNVNGILNWAKIVASDSAINARGICVDKSGDISIVGEYYGTGIFGNASTISLISTADFDVFIAHYDQAGNILWAKSAGGPGVDFGGGISADQNGNLYITGDFHLSSFHASAAKIFISKYDITGICQWLIMPQTYGNFHYGMGIKTDKEGNSFITGQFFNTLIFDTLNILNANNIECNVFLAKFNTNGKIIWIQKAGAATGYTGAESVDIDEKGNSYITGFYRGTISFGSINLSGPAGISYDVFIAKCDSSGNFSWVNRLSGPGTIDEGRSICTDKAGGCYVTGYFLDSISAGTSTVFSNGGIDIFVAHADSSGNFSWMKQCGSASDDNTGGIKANSFGVFITGNFINTIEFNGTLPLTGDSLSYDIFVAKINNSSTGVDEINSLTSISLFPNPSENLIQLNNLNGEWKYFIYDISGREILQGIIADKNNIQISNLKNGIYFLRLIDKDGYMEKEIKFIRD